MPNLAALLLPLFAPAQGPLPESILPKAPAPDKVVAKVNGVEIRAKDVEALLWDWRGHEVTQDLITYHLVLGESKRVKVEVKPEEIERSYQERLAEYAKTVPQGTNIDEVLREQGFTKSRLFLRVHAELLVNRIAMQDFRPDNFVSVSTSLYRTKGVATAAQRATAARDRLVKGEAWDKIIQESDLDEGSKQGQGTLGWRLVTAFPESARPDIKSLKAGEISKPIAMPDGSVQIFRVDKRGLDAKDAEARELQDGFLNSSRQKLLERLRKEAKIEKGQ
jgi:parvulin-like peptidyl-prolyl isomerase